MLIIKFPLQDGQKTEYHTEKIFIEKMDYKKFFPVFTHHPDLIFLDSGASSQKPAIVLNTIKKFCETSYANIHRGNYSLSIQATEQYDDVRKKAEKFLGTDKKNIIFTKNGTEASNIFANGFAAKFLKSGDEILIPISEHHANMLPWMRAAKEKNATITWVYPDKSGVFNIKNFEEKISSKTKLIAFAHVSNVTGQIFPVQEIVKLAKKFSAYTILDACQSIPKMPFNFDLLGVDAAFFTGHKFGSGGTGGLLLSEKFFDIFDPLLVGGDIVQDVSINGYDLLPQPEKFETGTPAIENIVGLGAAIDFCSEIGMQKIFDHEQDLIAYGLAQIEKKLPNWKIIGPKKNRSGNISLIHPDIHHQDIGALLSEKNICVRTGFHCAHPFHTFLKTSGTVRASFWIYNTKSDIDAFIAELIEIEKFFL